jgi:hypothetical protein
MKTSARNGGGAIRWSRVIVVCLLFGAAPYTFTFGPTSSEINDIASVAAKSKALAEKMGPTDGAFLPLNPRRVGGAIPISGAVILKTAEKADAVQVILGARKEREAGLGDHVPVLWNRDEMLSYARECDVQLNRLLAESRYIIGVALGIFLLAVLVLVAILRSLVKQVEAARASLNFNEQAGVFKRMLTWALVGLAVVLVGWSIGLVLADRGFGALWTLVGYLPAFALLQYRRQWLGRDRQALIKAA